MVDAEEEFRHPSSPKETHPEESPLFQTEACLGCRRLLLQESAAPCWARGPVSPPERLPPRPTPWRPLPPSPPRLKKPHTQHVVVRIQRVHRRLHHCRLQLL